MRVEVKGEVTGVGFRYAALHEAGNYPALRGYVRNQDSRTVECVVQGPHEDVELFVAWLRRGPSAARVKSCHISAIANNPLLPPFTLRY